MNQIFAKPSKYNENYIKYNKEISILLSSIWLNLNRKKFDVTCYNTMGPIIVLTIFEKVLFLPELLYLYK